MAFAMLQYFCAEIFCYLAQNDTDTGKKFEILYLEIVILVIMKCRPTY